MSTPRLVWPDLARGGAVVSMLVAHVSPIDGPLALSEYLTAPLFAFLIGASLRLAWDRRPDPRSFLASALWRGLVLLLAGVWLQSLYLQIDVVLQTLGLLTIVAAPLVIVGVTRPVVLWVGAAVFALLSPWLLEVLGGRGTSTGWVGWLAGGLHYRVTSFLVFALVGAAVVNRVATVRRGWRGLVIPTGLLALSVGAYLGGRLLPGGSAAYSGTTAELVGATLLCLFAVTFCAWLVVTLGDTGVRRWLGAMIDTGRMAFSAYAVQILALVVITSTVLVGQRDDHLAVLVGLIVGILALCWVWLHRFQLGPLEWLLRLPDRWLRRSLRHD